MPLIVISRREQIDMQRVATDVHRKANNHEPRRADSSYGLFQYIPELVQCVCTRCAYWFNISCSHGKYPTVA